ncbi:hypothetical protein G6F57_001233 [Rhizopus arrhizus]|uniref:PHD-type domain-containing protein n=1 Tax=Rhizopus oryzae TaxID=64495 RepID=A0A9P7BWQ1_RHIOR|nr:hypothetical protein G6F24_001978 [Rhizopus arrhizus]KAG1424959.1 hypothetical protein G6F58_002140 [Rhizopus delemar]KAG0795416.1 hypothetical protein G6F21_002119 [Rhizopus arrhizus]KAG0801779.1 hypothetical protein G6F22_000910 [Rhizopus arrhizus]KAG0817078.1 hypothetical protein G6F20_002678 [Rhizopus arrhizus]
MKNHDVCDACGGVGQFICCDACPNAFHFTCVEPPVDSNDVDNLTEWFCNKCEHEKGKIVENGPKGLFKELVENLNVKNPTTFRLPEEIINFFEGVSSDEVGNYIDTTQLRQNKNGDLSDNNYSTAKDKNGRFIQCYHCRKISLKKLVIACDYCSLYWHLDCLTPPLAATPNSTKRWRCPNHVESILKPKRQQKHAEIMNTNCINDNHFNIIISEETEEEKEKDDDDNSDDNPILNINNKATADIVTNKDGMVYVLPMSPIQFNTVKSQDESATTSEASTPTTFVNPPKHNKDRFETCLSQYNYTKQQTILSLLKTITSNNKANKPPDASPIPTFIPNKYKKYKKIANLLKQKDEQEILSLLCKIPSVADFTINPNVDPIINFTVGSSIQYVEELQMMIGIEYLQEL